MGGRWPRGRLLSNNLVIYLMCVAMPQPGDTSDSPPHPAPRYTLATLYVVVGSYSMILDTTPAPTVRPPSRRAKRRPSCMATGSIKLHSTVALSPGITISVPSGRVTSPVTSVQQQQQPR